VALVKGHEIWVMRRLTLIIMPAKSKKKNSLVNNINARKKSGTSRSKKKSTVSKKAYKDMQDKWGKDR
jgi:hypothetical protein